MLCDEFVKTYSHVIPVWGVFSVLPGHTGFLLCSSQDTPTPRWPKSETPSTIDLNLF